MAPPAKRQRRNVIRSSPGSEEEQDVVKDTPRATTNSNGGRNIIDLCSSEIEDSPFVRRAQPPEPAPKSPNKSRQSTLTRNGLRGSTVELTGPPSRTTGIRSQSKSLSPEKKKAVVKVENGSEKNGNIFSFFTNAAKKQIEAPLPTQRDNLENLEEDISTDEDDIAESKVRQKSSFTTTAVKRSRSMVDSEGSSVVGSSQRFKKPSIPAAKPKVEEDLRPWAERFAPHYLEELAVHKRKVADVREWLENVMAGKSRQRVLILKGASGTGKTTTVQLLAKAMGAQVLEWRNPVGYMTSDEGTGFVSVTQQFDEFIGRGGKFGQLDIFDDPDALAIKPETKPLDRRKSLLLVEEFPNTFMKSSTILQGFRSAILQYLAANTPSQADHFSGRVPDNVVPLVMVVSENLLTTTSAAADSFTAHRLLGPEILHHPGVSVIEFNPIAPTFLQKALGLVVLKESRKTGRRKTPGALVLKQLGEIGDVRSAVGSLEFMCLQGDDADWGANINFAGGSKKRGAKDAALTKMEEESLELITRREASLGIFHAVGRVVHNKRSAEPTNEALPPYLAKHARARKSEVVVDELIDETGTDTSTFLSALQENYALSCNHVDKFPYYSDMDHLNACIDALSDADLMSPSWDGWFNPTGFSGGTGGRGSGGDISRQDELSFQVAVRGILFGLPDPVVRHQSQQGGFRKGGGKESNQMFYPTALKLWRQKEETESLVDLSVTRVMKGDQIGGKAEGGIMSGALAFKREKKGVETWSSNRPPATQRSTQEGKKEADDTPMVVGLGGSARKEMLLERLPYLVKISRASFKRPVLLPLPVSELEKVTKFTGIGVVVAKEDDEDAASNANEETPIENWATDKPTEGSPQRRRIERGKLVGNGHDVRLVAEQLEKTVLSDDDIED